MLLLMVVVEYTQVVTLCACIIVWSGCDYFQCDREIRLTDTFHVFREVFCFSACAIVLARFQICIIKQYSRYVSCVMLVNVQ